MVQNEHRRGTCPIPYYLRLHSISDDQKAEDVANEYGVSAVPTFMLFKDGEMLPEEKISGPHHQKVREMIEKNLK